MIVHSSSEIFPTLFKDLARGDVFYLLKDVERTETHAPSPENVRILMRCGHKSTDMDAVDIRSGACWSFNENDAVVKLSAKVAISRATE